MNITLEERQGVRRDLGLLVGLGLLCRLFFLLAMPRVLDTADAIHYVETAQHLATGDFFGYDPKIPVLYPLLAAAAHLLIPDLEWACRMVSFVASVLVVAPLYLLARDLFGRRPAQMGALTAAIWPWLADYGCRVSTEATAVWWWFLGVWLLARALRGGRWATLGAPVAFFALHLTRPEGLFILLCAPVAGLLLCCGDERRARWRLVPFGVICGGLLLLNAVYVRALTGNVTANYRVGFILEEFDLLRFAHTSLQTLTDVFPVMLGPVLFLFLGVGLFHRGVESPDSSLKTPDFRLERYLLVFVLAQWAVSLFVLSPAPRYLMAPLMALALWSARGMVVVSRQAAAVRWGRVLRWAPVGAMVGMMAVHTAVTVGSEHLGRRPREPREYKTAGLWMKEHLDPGLVFCRKPQIGYYAGMPSTGPALEDTVAEAVVRAQCAGARYFVVDERYTASDAPALRPLLDPSQAPPALRLLQGFAPYPESRVVVYELAQGPARATPGP